MKIRSLAVAAAILICTACTSKLPYVKFDDAMLSYRHTDTFDVVTGRKGLYVLSGTFYAGGQKRRAGEAVLLTGPSQFRIKELLDRYPSLRESWLQVSEAEEKQEAFIAKHLRNLTFNDQRQI